MLLDPRTNLNRGDDSCQPNFLETDVQTKIKIYYFFFFFFHEKHSCPEDQKTPVDTFSLKGNIYMRSQIIKDFQ